MSHILCDDPSPYYKDEKHDSYREQITSLEKILDKIAINNESPIIIAEIQPNII